MKKQIIQHIDNLVKTLDITNDILIILDQETKKKKLINED